ncbi:hypothetical protein GCM10008927_21510 [Amylibacter ulvae]|uniref:DUF2244 domain-containing protein n=1 Tax=Paramylibacter ulvae TaxID=1651968 RepID=A0ABQ3D4N4_9RHOB|nr:DUF2244 domain-containing protein [Amylibacter ulvae]GHA55281.1 hypothetical protein GCM10008927_21510 [Amylibacter ulvae]
MVELNKISKAADVSVAFFAATNRPDAPLFDHTVRAHRSLPRVGFVWLIGVICVMFLLPLGAFIGHIAMWMILAAMLITIATLWYFLERSYTDSTLSEHIRIWPDTFTVERHNPRAQNQYWITNPYWVRLKLQDTPVAQSYLTATDGKRTIELGAFLSPEERVQLRNDIDTALKHLR